MNYLTGIIIVILGGLFSAPGITYINPSPLVTEAPSTLQTPSVDESDAPEAVATPQDDYLEKVGTPRPTIIVIPFSNQMPIQPDPLVKNAGTPIELKPADVSPETVPTCSEQPVLSLTGTTTPAGDSAYMVSLKGSYSTGCDLDMQTTYIFMQDGHIKLSSGNLENKNGAYITFSPQDDKSVVIRSSGTGVYEGTHTFKLTIGNITKEVTL